MKFSQTRAFNILLEERRNETQGAIWLSVPAANLSAELGDPCCVDTVSALESGQIQQG